MTGRSCRGLQSLGAGLKMQNVCIGEFPGADNIDFRQIQSLVAQNV